MLVSPTDPYLTFGTRNRTMALMAIAVLDHVHAAELSRMLGISQTAARYTLDSLEEAGLTVGAYVGRTRLVSLNPRFWARAELEALLHKMALADPQFLDGFRPDRRRPRRKGKPI